MREPRVGCLGLSYKPEVGDVRESPAVAVIGHLLDAGIGPLLVHDPFVEALPRAIARPGVIRAELGSLIEQANVVALLTDHQAYRALGREALAGRIVIDPSGAWSEFERSRSGDAR
jgi:UDP-N-acetyl-D-mannosaminuronic acid dehydrogenase